MPRRKAGAASGVYVALLRAVNVGGNNMVSMKALASSFQKAGFRDVATYINSGNVMFRSAEHDSRAIESVVDSLLSRNHGIETKCIVRSADEIAGLVRTMNTTWKMDEAWRYHVLFLRHTIDSKAVLRDFDADSDLERVTYCPGTLLWSVKVDGVERSAITKLLGRRVSHDMTARNVNTTRRIFELMQAMQGMSDRPTTSA
ncbi:MAG TPA: DUF1697 domain-containing protein [Gemmatimonadaceae bacterium]|nr:DUF1697 domain-containing protein [Gemmatimonadaceae bacterium]